MAHCADWQATPEDAHFQEGGEVLLLDDDQDVLRMMEEVIGTAGFKVTPCALPGEALKLLDKKSFQVIVSDHRMPEMDGLEFLGEAHRKQPMASRILITGAASLNMAVKAINSGLLFRFLTKPVEMEELTQVLQDAEARFRLKKENAELQEKTTRLNELLAEANEGLRLNFDHSMDLCRNLAGTFSPLLEKTTRAVEEICRQFCGQNLLSPAEEKVLMVSATLHNIGLIGIPRELIQTSFRNPGRLTDEQKRLIEKHPLYGETLVEFVGNLSGVAETIRAHHERWDGEGYPDGLREEAIPMPARYLAVAAAFVECGYEAGDAHRFISSQSNKAFFPEAVRAFSTIFHGTNLPKRVREITFKELRPGMVLANSLHSPAGLLLLPEGKVVRSSLLEKIRNHDIMDHVNDPILVYLEN